MRVLQKLFIPLVLFIIILFTYWDLPKTFFQQDEWQTFAANIYFLEKGTDGIIESFLPKDPLAHFNPLARVFSWYEYMFYKTNFSVYAWQSIFLHIINVVLLFYFVSFLLNNKKIAFIAALFFGANSIPSQVVSWAAAANSYEIPTLFILASLLFFQKFLVDKSNRKRNIIFSLLALFVSLLFHENGIFLFLFYPIIFFLSGRAERKKLFPIFSYSIVIFALAFILIRIPLFFGITNPIPKVTEISPPPISGYPYRIVSLGVKSLSASFFPEKTLIQMSEELVRLAYPQFITSDNVPSAYITQSIVFDLVSYVMSIIILGLVAFIIKIVDDKKIRQVIFWSLIFIPLSVIPYAFLTVKAGYASIFEPKFLYIPSIGASLLFAAIIYELLLLSRKSKTRATFVLLFLGFFILFHIFQTRAKIDELETMGGRIKTFLTTIYSSYPKLPEKVIFFTQSDRTYYGMPDNEKILPVQIGFGKMLMIWYQKTEQFPRCMYEDHFLIKLLEEGYRNCQGRGFGYFRDYNKLLKTIKELNRPITNVISFSWNGNDKTFKNITLQTQEALLKDLGK